LNQRFTSYENCAWSKAKRSCLISVGRERSLTRTDDFDSPWAEHSARNCSNVEFVNEKSGLEIDAG